MLLLLLQKKSRSWKFQIKNLRTQLNLIGEFVDGNRRLVIPSPVRALRLAESGNVFFFIFGKDASLKDKFLIFLQRKIVPSQNTAVREQPRNGHPSVRVDLEDLLLVRAQLVLGSLENSLLKHNEGFCKDHLIFGAKCEFYHEK